jgi:hypothetical protein
VKHIGREAQSYLNTQIQTTAFCFVRQNKSKIPTKDFYEAKEVHAQKSSVSGKVFETFGKQPNQFLSKANPADA